MFQYPDLGVGILIHNSQRYMDYIDLVHDKVDAYEIIMGQYEEEPNVINDLKERVNKPMLLHTIAFSFGTDTPIHEPTLDKVKDRATRCQAEWCSDHICFTGVPGLQTGALLPPILTEESLDIFVDRVNQSIKHTNLSIVLENTVMHYNPVGTMTYAEFITEMVKRTNAKLLLSIENITGSSNFSPMDHYEFIDALPCDQIVQIHCTLGNTKEAKELYSKKFGTIYEKQLFHFEVLEYLSKHKKVKPKAMIWELETATDSLPEASELMERIDWAKEIFFAQKELNIP